jgi:hypothetical protein
VLKIRPAQASEREEVGRFLYHSFKAKIPLERWRSLIDGRLSRPGDGYGVSLMDSTDLVGFLGMVHAKCPLSAASRSRLPRFVTDRRVST